MIRKGLGIGLGKGYYNLVPKDPYIHSLSAKGVKTKQVLNAKRVKKDKKEEKETNWRLRDSWMWLDAKNKEWDDKSVSVLGIKLTYDEYFRLMDYVRRNTSLWERMNDEEKKEILKQIKTMSAKGVIPEYSETYEIDYIQDKLEPDISITTFSESKEKNKKDFLKKAKDLIKKTGEVAKKGIERGEEYIKKKQLEIKELHQIPDDKLKQLAIQEGKSIFGGLNKYEKELIRREKEKKYLEDKLKEVKNKGLNTKVKTRTDRENDFDPLGFLNPFQTIKR